MRYVGNVTSEFVLTARQRNWLIAFAAIWFCGWLIATAPARIFVGLVHKMIPALQLDSVEGSLWQGSARQAFVQTGGRTIALGRVDWRFYGWSLLLLHPTAHVGTSWGDQIVDTNVRLSPLGSVSLRDTRAVFPVALLQLWAPLPARGNIGINLQSAMLVDAGLRAVEGAVDWQGAQWQWGERWLALGDYRVALDSASDDLLKGEISGGTDLAASGTFTLGFSARTYQVDTKIAASRTLPKEFRDSLVFLLGAKPQQQTSVDAGAGAPVQLLVQRQGKW